MKKITSLILLTITLFGCATRKKEIARLNNYAIKYPDPFRKLSNLLNPCFSGKAKSDTVFSSHTDTLIQDGQSIIERVKDTVYVTKMRTIRNTITRDIHDTVTNDRLIAVKDDIIRSQRDSLIAANTMLSTEEKQNKTLLWVVIGLSVLVIGGAVLTAYRFFSGGFLK